MPEVLSKELSAIAVILRAYEQKGVLKPASHSGLGGKTADGRRVAARWLGVEDPCCDDECEVVVELNRHTHRGVIMHGRVKDILAGAVAQRDITVCSCDHCSWLVNAEAVCKDCCCGTACCCVCNDPDFE